MRLHPQVSSVVTPSGPVGSLVGQQGAAEGGRGPPVGDGEEETAQLIRHGRVGAGGQAAQVTSELWKRLREPPAKFRAWRAGGGGGVIRSEAEGQP